MSKKAIHEFSLGHLLLRNYVDFYLYTFFDKVTVVGKDNIPKDKPVIFALNHQDALMDALAVLCTLKKQPVFMARADIFKSKTAAKILRFFKILPIYRIRDGIKNLQNNDAVFEEAIAVLEAKKWLVILPEGSHLGERRLRALKKGVARIAMTAEERNNFELDIQVIPIGLDYSHYINFGADLLVNIGKPFPVSDFKNIYEENPQKGMNAFLQELRKRMLPQMLNISDTGHYNEIETLKDIYITYKKNRRQLKDNHKTVIEYSQKVADRVIEYKKTNPEEFDKLSRDALNIKDLVRELKLRYWVVDKKRIYWLDILLSILAIVVLFPFFAIGFVTNILPFHIPVLATKKIKDPQFLSSVRFAVALITFTLFYLIYLILLLIFVKPWYLALGGFVSIFLLGLFSFRYYVGVKKTFAKLKVKIWQITKNSKWAELKTLWNSTVEQVDEIVRSKQ